MSLLRLSSLDRSSLGIPKRLSLLPTKTATSNPDELPSSLATSRTLPCMERLDNDDFLNMFGSTIEQLPSNAVRSIAATRDRGLPPELSATPTTSRFPELHAVSTQRHELAPSAMPLTQPQRASLMDEAQMEAEQMGYRSSVSSSIPSTKKSNASSRISRRSSVSSMTGELSSSDRSIKDFDRENALHERLKRRAKEKRVSFMRIKPATQEYGQAQQSRVWAGGYSSRRSSVHDSSTPKVTSPRPGSRGKRLGQAMAGGLPVSPQSQTTPQQKPATAPAEQKRKDHSHRLASATSLNRVLDVLPIDEIDRVRVGIMSQLDNLLDLRACATTSRDFYKTFQKYESMLVDIVLFKQSQAAWDLRYAVRQLEKPSPFRLKSVLRDYTTVQALEDFIIWRCQTILRPQSLAAFLGDDAKRKAELEDAIWLVWSFAVTFGKASLSDATLHQQTQWLNGEHDPKTTSTSQIIRRVPCTKQQLEDMSEIWRCLEMLLSGFKDREEEARQAGVFDNAVRSRLSDKELLSAWVHDILSLGPKAVLTLSSCDFDQARVLGITKWKPPTKGKSRANFLKGAVEEVYRDRLMKEARQIALDYRKSVRIQQQHKRSSSDPPHSPAKFTQKASLPISISQPLRVDTKRSFRQSMPLQGVLSSQGEAEIRPDCDPLSPSFTSSVLSPSSNPTVFSPLSMTKNISTKLGPTLFPMQNRDQSQRLSIATRSGTEEYDVSVPDPTDRAVSLMVEEMGFSQREAKRALALSDTGSGINIEVAVEILSSEPGAMKPQRKHEICELPASNGEARVMGFSKVSKAEVCEGHCKPILLVGPRRDRVSGLGMVKRGLSYRMSFRRSTKLSSIPDVEEGTSPPGTSNTAITQTRESTLDQLASSAISAFTAPAIPRRLTLSGLNTKEVLPTHQEHSPVSPINPTAPEWLKPDAYPITIADGANPVATQPKPRVTLQRVGTGVKKTKWNIARMKKSEHIIEPEIIGYAY